jgi:hypothetical protein
MSKVLNRRPARRCAAWAMGVAALAGIIPTNAYAATQGTQGATSTGTVAISASVPSRVRITGLVDVAFTNQDPSTAASNAQNVCVWSNTATKGYSVTATGSGTAGAFTLTNGSTTVPYSVQWNESSAQTSGSALTSGTAGTGLNSTATHNQCAAGPAASASLIVGIASADLSGMEAASNYTGTLTLVVAPE